MKMIVALLAATTVTIAVPAMAAPMLFNSGTPNAITARGGDSGVGQSFAVTTATTLTNIGFYSASPFGGNLRYLIFDAAGANLLFSITDAATNLSNTTALIKSPTFSFDLAAGSSYQFGIISDSVLGVGYDFPASLTSQNGLTSFGSNSNYANYATPSFRGFASASIPVVLYGTQGTVQAVVPEPAAWTMIIFGMGAIGFTVRAAKRRSDKKFDAKIKRITDGALA